MTLARRAGEWHAAAGILREAADYCTRAALPYADDLRLRSAEAWVKAAGEAQQAGHPLQIVENAYLAAAEAFASVRAFRQVVEVYRRLASMELPVKARERYRRLVDRLGEDRQDAPRPVPVPEFLKQLPEYEEVWYVDLAEWELDGDPALIAAGIMADRRYPDFVRRHALLLVLELERRGTSVGPVDVVRRLEAIKAYPVIAALEKLYERPDPATREAVAAAMGNLRFKRSFGLIGRALRDDDASVREAAAAAVARLVFPHAFEPLRRIFDARDLADSERARGGGVAGDREDQHGRVAGVPGGPPAGGRSGTRGPGPARLGRADQSGAVAVLEASAGVGAAGAPRGCSRIRLGGWSDGSARVVRARARARARARREQPPVGTVPGQPIQYARPRVSMLVKGMSPRNECTSAW